MRGDTPENAPVQCSTRGRGLVTAAALAQAVLPWVADWNRRHTFGPGYGAHARWHGAAEVVSATGDSALVLWLLWGRENDQTWRLPAAATVPVIRWGAFNIVLPLSTTSPHVDPRRPVRLVGLPPALLAQNAIAGLSLLGLWRYWRHRRGRLGRR
jgi:hypothetical protein